MRVYLLFEHGDTDRKVEMMSIATEFQKKPIRIKAVRVTDEMRRNFGPFPEWALHHLVAYRIEKINNSEAIIVKTLEGEMLASPGDWLILGVKCEVYPCKDDIFRASYDPVDGSFE